MEGTGAGLRLRCAAALLPVVLLLVLASPAGASGLRASAAGSWGPAGRLAHRTRAMRVRSSGRARAAGRGTASPSLGGVGTIEGKVTDAVTGEGIKGLEVCAWPEEEEFFEPECRETGVEGKYQLSSLAVGEYIVEFATPFNSALNYVAQFYSGAASFELATPVTVNSGSTSKGVNAKMAHGGRVAGKVTAAAGGAPIKGVEVCAWNAAPESESFGCGETDSSGEYLVTGLAPGSYRVGFRSTPGVDYITQFYSGKATYLTGDEVTVVKEATTEPVNAAMVRGGEISGLVTVGGTGTPVSEALVCALSSSEAVFVCEETAPNGEYTIMALPAGDYDVGFLAAGFEEEFWDGVFSLEEATPVGVTLGSATPGISAAMYVPPRLEEKRFPTITGTIAVGSTLSCSPGSWTGTALTFGYQWLRDRVPIPGATATTYTIQNADVGHFVACEVTASNPAGSSWAISIGYRVPVPPPVPTPTPTTMTTTPPPQGGVQDVKIVAPSIAVLGRLSVAHGNAVVKLRCAVGPCKGSLQLTLTVTRRRRSGGRTVTRHVTITIGSASFSLAEGATGKVSIHLTSQGRKLLPDAARHPHPAKLKLTMQNAPARSTGVVVG